MPSLTSENLRQKKNILEIAEKKLPHLWNENRVTISPYLKTRRPGARARVFIKYQQKRTAMSQPPATEDTSQE